jgi:hypothetical protein
MIARVPGQTLARQHDRLMQLTLDLLPGQGFCPIGRDVDTDGRVDQFSRRHISP